MKRAALFAAALLGAGIAASADTEPVAGTTVTPFSQAAAGGEMPPPWRLQTYPKIPRHTRFELVAAEGVTLLHVRADTAAASLTHPLRVEPVPGLSLSWRWQPLRAPDRSALGAKDSDDWGARVYVLFEPPPESMGFGERLALGIARALHGDDLPARALCYVWLPGGRIGDSAPNAYTDRVHMIVVDGEPPGAWRTISRDIAADYRTAFGTAAPPISGVAVSADSDTGGGVAEVLFGDLRLIEAAIPSASAQ